MGLFDFWKKPRVAKGPSIDISILQKRGFSEAQAVSVIEQLLRTTPAIKTSINEDKLSFSPEDVLKLNFYRAQSIKQYSEGCFNLSNLLVSLWTKTVTDRRNYLTVSNEIRKFYVVDAILELIAEEVLNAKEDGEIVRLKSDNPKIQEELDSLQDKVDFDVLLEEITADFINMGEYFLSMKIEPGKGVVGIYDDVDPLCVLALYSKGVPKNYLTYIDHDYAILPATSYAHFVIGSNKLRFRLESELQDGFMIQSNNEFPPAIKDKLPDYVRIGKPFFYGIIPKMRELELLEKLIPATKLNQITQSQLVSMRVPASMSPEKAMEALRRYEALLNIPTGIDTSQDQISLAEIMTASGKIRVIPNFSDEKGQLEPLNVRDNPSVDDILNSVKDLRAVILSSLGIPPTLLFGGGDTDKSAELRMFGRYTRRLSRIQKGLSRGLKQVAMAHLLNRGLDVVQGDVDVIFTQSLVDISGLEKLEFDDAKQEIVGRTLDFVRKMTDDPVVKTIINPEHLAQFLKDKFSPLTEGGTLFDDSKTLELEKALQKSIEDDEDRDDDDVEDPTDDEEEFKSSDNLDDTPPFKKEKTDPNEIGG